MASDEVHPVVEIHGKHDLVVVGPHAHGIALTEDPYTLMHQPEDRDVDRTFENEVRLWPPTDMDRWVGIDYGYIDGDPANERMIDVAVDRWIDRHKEGAPWT